MGIYKWSFLRSDMETRFSDYLERVRSARPLVHHITNYVTVNDCANICICAGGSPVMTDGEDVADMVAIASASVLNIGTLNGRTVHSMEVAASVAFNRIPFLLDPVGAGATQYRTDTSEMLMRFHPTVIKGNAGEIGVLSGIGGDVKGVDSHGSEDAEEAVRSLSRSTGSIVVATGAVDYIADGDTVLRLENGTPMLENVSGTGCMLSSVVGCYIGACGRDLMAVAAAVTAFNVSAEIAAEGCGGPGTFKPRLMDAMFALDCETLDSRARWERL